MVGHIVYITKNKNKKCAQLMNAQVSGARCGFVQDAAVLRTPSSSSQVEWAFFNV